MAVANWGENDTLGINQNGDEDQPEFNELPEDERNSLLGNTLSNVLKSTFIFEIGALINNFQSRRNKIKSIGILQNLINKQEVVSEDILKTVVNENDLDYAIEKYKEFYDVISNEPNYSFLFMWPNPEEIKLIILRVEINRQIEAAKKEIAEDTFKTSSFSGTVILTQFIKLYVVWKNIRQAENLSQKFKTEIRRIEEMMTQISKEVAFIVNLMERYDKGKYEESRLSFAKKVERLTRRNSRRLNKTQIIIGELKAAIGKKIERIDDHRNEQIFNGISNVVQGVYSVYQFYVLDGLLNTGYRLVQGFIPGAFLFLTAGNAVLFVITRKNLKVLRSQLTTIRSLSKEVLKLQKSIVEADKWCET